MNRLFRTLGLMLLCVACNHVVANWPPVEEGETPSLAPLLKSIEGAVVNISTRRSRQSVSDAQINELYGFLFPRRSRVQEEFQFSGSGVVIDAEKGLVATNHHVIGEVNDVAVTLTDGRQFEAEIIGSDEETDIALLRIEADTLKALNIGDSDELEVGDYVIAIGNPFGIGQSVTTGIVSALGRKSSASERYEDFIQTDASINPGNSGGALIDLHGNLIGINTAIISPSRVSAGIGLAIPSNMASAILDQLIRFENVERGYFGVAVLTNDTEDLSGALVTEVIGGSPAERTGVEVGDVIVALDGKKIDSGGTFISEVALKRAGEDFTITVQRDNRELDFVTGTQQAANVTIANDSLLASVKLANVPPTHDYYQANWGVLISYVPRDSLAYRRGLRQGDLIVRLNQVEIGDVDNIDARLLQGSPLIVEYARPSGSVRDSRIVRSIVLR